MAFFRVLFIVTVVSLLMSRSGADEIDFDRDIRTVLSSKCYACHGPDEKARQADLRLDVQEAVFGKRDTPIVTPKDISNSELFARISSDDPDYRMPPVDSNRSALTKREIELVRAWIEQGAEWGLHWAYRPLAKLDPPVVDGDVNNEIDQFIFDVINKRKFTRAKEADRVSLIRRLSFDLLGLPPSQTQVEEFLNDQQAGAYERLVDRMLESRQYGERMAMYWLDVVRYADSNGYHSDEPRSISPYRDYVIKAFNDNMPYDRFVIEQLAGDILPEATMQQKIASGFNMLLQTTSEGGAQAKEYLAKYSADRVRNTSAIFLGSTMGCAECHDHKFDPFTTKDFYSFAAFFADIKQKGVGNPDAYPVQTDDSMKQLAKLDEDVARYKRELQSLEEDLSKEQAIWEADLLKNQSVDVPDLGVWHSAGPFSADNFDKAYETSFVPEQKAHPVDANQESKWRKAEEYTDGKVHPLADQAFSATYLYRDVTATKESKLNLSLGSDDGIKVWLNGQLALDKKVRRGPAADQETLELSVPAGRNGLLIKIVNDGGGAGFYFEAGKSGISADLFSILKTAPDKRSAEQMKKLADHYYATSPQLKKAQAAVAEAEARKKQFVSALPKTLMTVSTKPMVIRVLPRGNWLDESGPVMQPQVPLFLNPVDVKGRTANRLDLANWIVDPTNPLTARTFVNRLWKLYFGQGLATPLDDLGAQGTRPTHPRLLDWMAIQFMESGWNVKHMVRLLVTSATYRQSSTVAADIRNQDPYNRFYSRQARFRLDAEMVRDNALAIGGLLSEKIGGPSVKPYQPAGYWRHMNFPVRRWTADRGESLYRRGLYTWWQRMFLHPSLLAFDAPSREECTVERPRSNTPQQSLVLLNDPTYVEAARGFAEKILKNGGYTAEERIQWAYLEALSRQPTEQEIKALTNLVNRHLEDFKSQPDSADKLLSVGMKSVPDYMDKTILAAWTSVARVILNLHETITRR